MKYNDFCRTDIEFVTVEQLKEACLHFAYKKLVLVMSKQACVRYGLERFVKDLESRYELLWLGESVSYPTQKTLKEGLDALKGFEPEAILAIGGGSAIDYAKGMKAFYDSTEYQTVETITEFLQKKEIRSNPIDIIAVPTTAGTGAEVTKWATIWDCEGKCKYSIDKEELKPDKAFIVPEFTARADGELTITTGLDAMAHAMESYWSKKTSPLVRRLAISSVSITVEYLERIIKEPENISLREKQCLASVLSGLAFSMTRTTACHSISYPLTMQYQIPHGTAVAMTLAQVAEKNSGSFPEAEDLFALFAGCGGIRNYLEQVCGETVSLRLRDYGIARDKLPLIAQSAFTLGRMDNNPVDFNRQDVVEILEKTF